MCVNNKYRDDMIGSLSDLLPATHTDCYAFTFLSNARFLYRKQFNKINIRHSSNAV